MCPQSSESHRSLLDHFHQYYPPRPFSVNSHWLFEGQHVVKISSDKKSWLLSHQITLPWKYDGVCVCVYRRGGGVNFKVHLQLNTLFPRYTFKKHRHTMHTCTYTIHMYVCTYTLHTREHTHTVHESHTILLPHTVCTYKRI